MREGENQTLCANISNGALVGEDIEVLVNVQAQGESATGEMCTASYNVDGYSVCVA